MSILKEVIAMACVVLALTTLFLAGLWWGTAELQERHNAPYIESCRGAGGVPVSTGEGSLNCARPDGGWIDVSR